MPGDPTAKKASQVQITRLLRAIGESEDSASDELLLAVYAQLHGIAKRLMRRQPPGHSLQPTILVHEAWHRLDAMSDARWVNRGRFFAAAAVAMRRLLINHARERQALKRGGAYARRSIESVTLGDQPDDKLIELGDAIEALRPQFPFAARVVECRVFAGLSVSETAEALDCSERSVKRGWAQARQELEALLN